MSTNHDTKDIQQHIKVYIRGVTKGYFWYNSIVGSQKGEKLYCQPMNLLLKENDYLDLIDKEIKRQLKDIQSQIDTLKNEIETLKKSNRV